MVRRVTDAVELRQMIQKGIDDSTVLDRDCRECRANEVYWHEPDSTDCNWDLHSFAGPPNCAGVVRSIVESLRKQFNLPNP
jgi:hypothetical protein